MPTSRHTLRRAVVALSARRGVPSQDWLLLGGVSPAGAFRLYSKEQRFRLEAGWTALYFAPVPAKAARPDATTRSDAA